MIPERHQLGRLTTDEVAGLDGDRTLVVLPVGAVEQHGPHLPVLTDAILAQAILGRALELRRDDGRVFALPVQAYGKSNEHEGFAGTFALSADTLARVLRELAAWLAASGLRRLMFLNAHGGNTDVLDYVARDVRAEHEIMCVSASPFRFGLAGGIVSGAEEGFGIHAGEAETSMLLAVAPELVRTDRYVAELPAVRSQLRRLALKGAASFGWLTRDLSASGTIGDPRAASAEKGRAILDAEAGLVVELIDEALALPLPRRRNLGPVRYGEQTMVWSKGVVADGLVYLSGVEARLDDDGRPVTSLEEQTKLCLERVDARLREAGASFADSVKLVWYARERSLLPDFFRVRDAWLAERYPDFLRDRPYASTVVVAELSFEDVLVEIDCVALRS